MQSVPALVDDIRISSTRYIKVDVLYNSTREAVLKIEQNGIEMRPVLHAK
jgi:hypothetical protein